MRAHRRSIVLAFVLLVVLVPAWPVQSSSVPQAYIPAVSRGGLFPGFLGVQASKSAPEELIRMLPYYGVTWIRLSVPWSALQPTRNGPLRWEQLADFERQARVAAEAGLRILVVLHHPPRWATADGNQCAMVTLQHRQAFADFAAALVRRYSVAPFNVRHWVIGNEPDVEPALVPRDSWFGCWGDRNDRLYGGGAYADLLKVVTPAIRKADPQAVVIAGALLLDRPYNAADPRTLPGIYGEGFIGPAADYYDVLSFHSYTWANGTGDGGLPPEWYAWGANELARANYMRHMQAQAGVERPLMSDEMALLCGAPGPECQVQQAVFLSRTVPRHLAAGITSLLWYSLDDAAFWNSNLLDLRTGQPGPALFALRTSAGELTGAQYIGPLGPQSETMAGYLFRRGPATLVVFWADQGGSLTVPVRPGAAARCISYLGELLPCTDDDGDGSIQVPASQGATYVVILDAIRQ